MTEQGLRRYYKGRIAKLESRHRVALQHEFDRRHDAERDYRLLLQRLNETHALLTPEQRKLIISQPPPPLGQGDEVKTYERVSTTKDFNMSISVAAEEFNYKTGKRKTRGKLRKKALPRAAQAAIAGRKKYRDSPQGQRRITKLRAS